MLTSVNLDFIRLGCINKIPTLSLQVPSIYRMGSSSSVSIPYHPNFDLESSKLTVRPKER